MEATLAHLKKKQLVPKLRFKEFNDEWKIESLTKLYSNIVVGFVGTISNDYCDKEIGVQFIRTLNVKNGWFSNEGLQFVTKEFHQRNKKSQVKNGDILIARVGANMGLVCEIAGLVGEANSANVIIIKNQQNLSSGFYTSYLSSTRGQKQIQSKGAGGAQEVLNISVAKTIHVPFIPLLEQQKIASFLSTVDEKIQHLVKKKQLLEQYKKGVMQQLFSGKLRFKDENGKEYPKWEEKRLGDVGEIVSGLTYSPTDVNGEGVLVLRSSNVQDRRLAFDDNVYVKVNVGDFNPVKENDILICVRNGSKNLIGKNALVNKENAGVAFGAFMTIYRSDFNSYLFHYFDTDSYKDEVHKNLGATINSINGSDLKKFKIPFPSKAEQQKIANYLSSIDIKIESVTTQITQTQTFKKGLLQQMFV
jgi:type I restriction enzyme S subunit